MHCALLANYIGSSVTCEDHATHRRARITELGGQLFRLEGDDEVWRMLEEDAFEWSAQYNDYLVHYYDSAEEDPETHTSVWQWLKSAMELVDGDSSVPQPVVRGQAPGRERGEGGRGGVAVHGCIGGVSSHFAMGSAAFGSE